MKEILVRENYVTSEDIKKAEKAAAAHRSSVEEYLLSEGLLSKDLLGQAIAEALKVPYADLNSNQPSAAQVAKIPEQIARKYNAVLFLEDRKRVVITSDDPARASGSKEFQKLFVGKNLHFAYSLAEDINQALVHYHKPLGTRFSQIIKRQGRVAPEIVEEILNDAYTFHASDVHFEPQTHDVIVRFRIDGVLHEAGRLDKENYENILNRIKVQSRLRIDEHFAAQDGSMRFQTNGQMFDLRTSIMPTVDGEKIVLRVLATYIEGLSLGELGLSKDHQRILEESAAKPFGMILVTGPTGSGKTTTLYALLKLLNDPEVNITTIEDPVEYKLGGVNQIQVNPQTNLTFAQGLRSIVRQDPDIILVGEIRDNETAEIAVNAALTGHLLLSTFHANDAVTAIPRLLDMGVEPFLLASTLEVVIAQRLVRRICEGCRYSKVVRVKELEKTFIHSSRLFKGKTVTLYAGKGCAMCGNTGYRGRTGVFEFIRLSPKLQELILHNPSTQQVWEVARKEKSTTLFEDGMEKVRNGITTLEELMRVAPPSR